MHRGADLRVSARWILRVVLGFSVVAGVPARAQDIPGYPASVDAYDPREVRLLPKYCIYTQSFRNRVPGGEDSEEVKRWYEYMGDTFHALHHYCWGMMKTNRALYLAPNAQIRVFYLQSSISEFDYVIEHSNDDFILLPEILNKRAENLIRLNRGPEALLNLEKAVRLKPDYWPPYGTLGDYHKDRGEINEAREWLQKGLERTPDAAGLKRRLAELSSRLEHKKSSGNQ